MGRNLTNLYISSSYQFLTQVSGSELQDGLGNKITGSLDITASLATSASFAALATTASYATNALSSSFAITASYALNAGVTVSTASLLTTASAANNVITFTKGDASTFTVTVDTGSAVTINTGSLLVTASISNATTTFTKGDGSTFSITANNVVNADSASVATTATSASYVLNAVSSSYSTTALSSSYAATATSSSVAINATSASYATNALSASYAPSTAAFPYSGSAEITGSFGVTGSSNFKGGDFKVTDQARNAEFDVDTVKIKTVNGTQFTGSVSSQNGFTGSLQGTASFANNATSASFSTTSISSSYALMSTSSSVAINATSASYAVSANSAATATSASYATNATSASFASAIPNNLNITASNILVTNNLTVNGTASFAYTKTTTGSAVIIGDEFIILNADTPAAPYAGIQVYDTGSASTASFEWNGIGDYWITVEENGASAMILTGISGSKGSEVAPALNKLLKGQGNNTVADSNITDNGTIVSIATPVDVTGSINQLSGSFSGSVINNITDVYSTTAKINHVVSLTQAEYTAISASANPNTLYYITDAASFVTSASYADFALSASYSTTALSASYSNTALSASYALSASHAPTSVSASYALSSSYATFALGAGAANSATSASQAISSSYADTAASSSYALNATSASYATTALSSSYALNSTTASYALNANPAFPFTGSASILGALNVDMTGSRVGTVTSGSFTGSFVTNVVPSASITQSQIEKIVTLNAATYASLSSSAATADNTLYIISDTSASVAFNTVFSGSVRGEVRALSIASNTASLDLSTGNFFTLTLVSGSNTYINPSNILPGQTVNLRITQANPGNGTVSFPSSVKQVSGSVYVPTTGSGPVDIVTFASFDSTNLYLSNVKNLI